MKEPVTCDFSMAEVFRFLKELKENNNREYGLLICTSFYVRNEKSLFCPNNYFGVERQ